MILTENHQIKRTHKLFRFLDNLAFQSKNIYNLSNYLIRQEFIRTSKLKEESKLEHANWIRWTELYHILQNEYPETYKLLPAKSAQMVLKNLDESWSSYFGSFKGTKRSKRKGRINMPKYKDKENGRNVVILNNQQFKIKNGIIHFVPTLTKKIMFKPLKTKIPETAKLIQITISPRNEHYNFNVVYEVDDLGLQTEQGFNKKTGELFDLKEEKCLSIDLGINNFCTVSNNVDKDFFIINGKQIKSVNQWSNKFQAYSNVGQRKKNKMWRKRDNKLKYFFNKTSDLLIQKALEKGCKTIVVGYNEDWKQGVNLGRKTNQSFVQIPFQKFLFNLEYRCKIANLNLVRINESYTSKCSFLDGEEVKKQEQYAGVRVKRGLFKSATGILMNADLNGSLNILRKYLGTKFVLNRVEDFVVSPYRVSFRF